MSDGTWNGLWILLMLFSIGAACASFIASAFSIDDDRYIKAILLILIGVAALFIAIIIPDNMLRYTIIMRK